MKSTTITTKKDISIAKGTLIPSNSAIPTSDIKVNKRIFIRAGSTLIKRRGCFIFHKEGDYCYTYPYIYEIFDFICNQAILDGAEEVVSEDNKKVFKMFFLITENRIVPETGNYITEFETETIEEANALAKQHKDKIGGDDFQYIVRE